MNNAADSGHTCVVTNGGGMGNNQVGQTAKLLNMTATTIQIREASENRVPPRTCFVYENDPRALFVPRDLASAVPGNITSNLLRQGI